MQNIFITLFMFIIIKSLHAQVTPHPGWPIQSPYPTIYTSQAGCVVLPDNQTLVLGSSCRLSLRTLDGQEIRTLGNIHPAGLRGLVTYIGRNDTIGWNIATVTEPHTVSGCTLVVAQPNGMEIVTRHIYTPGSFNSVTAFDLDNDGNDELLLLADSLYCWRTDQTTFPGFPIPIVGDTSTFTSGVAVGRFTGYQEPLLFYATKTRLHARQVGDSAELPGFPLDHPYQHFVGVPMVVPMSDSFRIFLSGQRDLYSAYMTWNQRGEPVGIEHGIIGSQMGFFFSVIDIDGDGQPEIMNVSSDGPVQMWDIAGNIININDTLQQNSGGLMSNVVGYRPPNHQTMWFYLYNHNDTISVYGREGMNRLLGFPVTTVMPYPPGGLALNLSLIPPVNDTLHIILNNYASSFMMWDVPAQSGGIMECATLGQDYRRTSVYHPWQIPISNVSTSNAMPSRFTLITYPNPFNSSTTIEYTIPKTSKVEMKLYDITGREAGTLVNFNQNPGTYRVKLDASKLSSGIYFCRLNAGSFTATKKLSLVK